MRHPAFPNGITPPTDPRAVSRELFAMIPDGRYYDRPIALRNPFVFYEGHLPGFTVNTLIKLAHGQRGIDERLETLFARGIDPEDERGVTNANELWPSRDETRAFAAACDARVEEALATLPLEDDDVPALRNGEAVFNILEHELMHQETLTYMLREAGLVPHGAQNGSARAEQKRVIVPEGDAILGSPRDVFGWDNEHPEHVVHVPAFAVDAFNVTNRDWLEYVEATGAKRSHFDALPLDAPVYVTHQQAVAYANWKGARLMTEAEWHRASEGATPGNIDFEHWHPVAAGQYAPSVHGVYDLVGNGWEWTSTVFGGFEGFEPMPTYPQYSADFFDHAHFVMKGASPVTPRMLVRPSFRNWFRPNYPYVFATFRCVWPVRVVQ
jgi:iron(II)-dependent oxidoreductase